MSKAHRPRAGSMQYWPRKRAKRVYARVKSWPKAKEPKLLGFAGYKAGMTHVTFTDNRRNSLTKGETIQWPVTIIECPPLKIASIRFYKKTYCGLNLSSEIFGKADKELGRKIPIPKKTNEEKLAKIKPEEYRDIRVLAYTQPKLTGIGKKKPELFEIALGGNLQDKFNYAKENLGNEIKIENIFKNGDLVDIHAITKGKGYQGPVKRFGVSLRSHKSEKTKRGPASLGAWCSQGHTMYRVAHAGQMGYHKRTEYNKKILKIENDVKKINPKGGFMHYGDVKNSYILLKGSIAGPANRIIRFNTALRPNRKLEGEAPDIKHISLESHQG